MYLAETTILLAFPQPATHGYCRPRPSPLLALRADFDLLPVRTFCPANLPHVFFFPRPPARRSAADTVGYLKEFFRLIFAAYVSFGARSRNHQLAAR